MGLVTGGEAGPRPAPKQEFTPTLAQEGPPKIQTRAEPGIPQTQGQRLNSLQWQERQAPTGSREAGFVRGAATPTGFIPFSEFLGLNADELQAAAESQNKQLRERYQKAARLRDQLTAETVQAGAAGEGEAAPDVSKSASYGDFLKALDDYNQSKAMSQTAEGRQAMMGGNFDPTRTSIAGGPYAEYLASSMPAAYAPELIGGEKWAQQVGDASWQMAKNKADEQARAAAKQKAIDDARRAREASLAPLRAGRQRVASRFGPYDENNAAGYRG